MCEVAESLRFIAITRAFAEALVLRHRTGDGVVEALVQKTKIVSRDGRPLVVSHARNRLTEVAMIVGDLGN